MGIVSRTAVPAVVVIQGDGAGAGQGDALIGRAEHGLELAAHGVLHQLGIVAAQAGKLGAGLIVAGVHKVLGVPAALGDKVAKAQHLGREHKLDKFLLLFRQHTNSPFPLLLDVLWMLVEVEPEQL